MIFKKLNIRIFCTNFLFSEIKCIYFITNNIYVDNCNYIMRNVHIYNKLIKKVVTHNNFKLVINREKKKVRWWRTRVWQYNWHLAALTLDLQADQVWAVNQRVNIRSKLERCMVAKTIVDIIIGSNIKKNSIW